MSDTELLQTENIDTNRFSILTFENNLMIEIIPRKSIEKEESTEKIGTLQSYDYFDIMLGRNTLFSSGGNRIYYNDSIPNRVKKINVSLVSNKQKTLFTKTFDMPNLGKGDYVDDLDLSLLSIKPEELTLDFLEEVEKIYDEMKYITVIALDEDNKAINIFDNSYLENLYLILPLVRLGNTNSFEIKDYKIGIVDEDGVIDKFDILKTNITSETVSSSNLRIRTKDRIGFLDSVEQIDNEISFIPTNINMVENDDVKKTISLFCSEQNKFRLEYKNLSKYQGADLGDFHQHSFIRFLADTNQFAKQYKIYFYEATSYKQSKIQNDDLYDDSIQSALIRHSEIHDITNYKIDIDIDIGDIMSAMNYGLNLSDNTYENIMIVVEIIDNDMQFIRYEAEVKLTPIQLKEIGTKLVNGVETNYLLYHHRYDLANGINLDYNLVNYDQKDISTQDLNFELEYIKNEYQNKIDTYLTLYANDITDTITKYEIQILSDQTNELLHTYSGKLNVNKILKEDGTLDITGSIKLYVEKEFILLDNFIKVRCKILNDSETKFLSIKRRLSKTYDTKSLIYNDRYKFRPVTSVLHENKSIKSKLPEYLRESNNRIFETKDFEDKNYVNVLESDNVLSSITMDEDLTDLEKYNKIEMQYMFKKYSAIIQNSLPIINLTKISKISDEELMPSFNGKIKIYKKGYYKKNETTFSTFNLDENESNSINYFGAYLEFPDAPSILFGKETEEGTGIIKSEDILEILKDINIYTQASAINNKVHLTLYNSSYDLTASGYDPDKQLFNANNYIRLSFDKTATWVQKMLSPLNAGAWSPKLIILTNKTYQEFNLLGNKNINNSVRISNKLGDLFDKENNDGINFVDNNIDLVLYESNNLLIPDDSINPMDTTYKVPEFKDFHSSITEPDENNLPTYCNDLGFNTDVTSTPYYTKFKHYQVTDSLCSVVAEIRSIAKIVKDINNSLGNKITYDLYRNEGTVNNKKLILINTGFVPVDNLNDSTKEIYHFDFKFKFAAILEEEREYILNYIIKDNEVIYNKVLKFYYKPVLKIEDDF